MTPPNNRAEVYSGKYEWYTPREYLDAAIAVMGGIDLDPASSERAQEHVQAARYFTIDTNGLAQEWSGRVFLNPPYAAAAIQQFVRKLIDSVRHKRVSRAILLTNNATDTEWFHAALEACHAICLTIGRISFLEPRDDGKLIEKRSPTNGQAFFYFGANSAAFRDIFSEFGHVVDPPVPRSHRSPNRELFAR
jgi:phage N-6-adenine-methyltransferase